MFKKLSIVSTTTELLKNVRSCRDEVKQKGGLAAGYKVSGLLSNGLTVFHKPSQSARMRVKFHVRWMIDNKFFSVQIG